MDAGGDPVQVCVDTINKYRATLGLAPYQAWTDEQMCVDWQAKSDALSTMVHGAFQLCPGNGPREMAQNECPNRDGPPTLAVLGCLAEMWNEGPSSSNYKNITSQAPRDQPAFVYTKVACGFYTKPDGTVWAVQDFL